MTDTQGAAAPPAAKPRSALMVIRESIEHMVPQFAAALPAHIPAERFVRSALTAIQLNPDIVECLPKTIYAACMKAAQDGLVIDGREAAIAKFNTKMKVNGVEQWVPVAQYMPMVQGLLKRARNSGEISTITARCVYDRDKFHVVYGDEEKLTHEPCLEGDPGPLRLAYMVAKLKDGEIVRHVMTRRQIEKRKAAARSEGIWNKWEEEMWVKTVLRSGARFLPSSADRVDGAAFTELLERDNDLYDLDGDGNSVTAQDVAEHQQQQTARRRGRPPKQSTGGAGAKLNPQPAQQVDDIDPETGEVLSEAQPEQAEQQQEQPAAQPAAAATTPRTQAQQPGLPLNGSANDDGLAIPPHLRRAPAATEPPPPGPDDVI